MNRIPDPNETSRDWTSPEVPEHWSRNQARRDEHTGPTMANLADAEREQAWIDIEQELAKRQRPDGLSFNRRDAHRGWDRVR